MILPLFVRTAVRTASAFAFLTLVCIVLVGLPTNQAFAQGAGGPSAAPAAAAKYQFNLVANPLAILIGRVSAGFDYALTPQLTVGPRVQLWNLKLNSTTDFDEFQIREVGAAARVNYYPGAALATGFYAGGAAGYTARAIDTRSKTSNQAITGDGSALYLEGLGGYQWFWDQFNVTAGAGFQLPIGSSKIKVTDGTRTEEVALVSAGLTLELNIGFAF